MTKDETLKLALEALEADPAEMVEDENGHMVFRRIQAIITLREALAQPEQEPVAWRYRWSVEGGNWVWNYATYIERQKDDRCEPLYTTPPQRTWVGLTKDEVETLSYQAEGNTWKAVELAEAKLKEKNT
jgi:hypothetical protein